MQISKKNNTSSATFLIGLVVLGALCGQAESQFSEAASAFMNCYASCFFLCYITPGHTTSYCSLDCLKDCIIPKFTPDAVSHSKTDTHQFCKLGCASVMCSNISTKKNPQVVKVGKCVGSCDNMCTNSNCSSP
ncbi:hypothetical protein QQ045_024690 [Rhodiola kirilowii]